MWNILWLGSGILFWVMGFVRVGHTNDREPLGKAFLLPPQVIYLMCGQPHAANIPHGVMGFSALVGQLAGILFVLCGILFSFLLRNDFVAQIWILGIGSIVVLIIVYMLYQRYQYKVE